ncbi:MAG TPA: glycosyltransferase [Solirubrobacterales bacterium]|nr:glycosyltransferase [Solirubrobacterales bacterium]
MRIGICAYWFNRGQGVVARQLRSGIESLGHETFVLARPTRAKNIRPAFIDRTGVWDQPGITEATHYRIPAAEMVAWGAQNRLDVALFDQNYEFEAIQALRASGVRTVGRFVWEQFAAEHVEAAKRAFDVIYSLTACEQERYATMGIESPRVQWGIHPELLEFATDPSQDGAVTYFYPAGFLSKRKPVPELVKAFGKVKDAEARLVIKGQVERQTDVLDRAAARDPRIDVVLEDLPTEEHLRLFAAADVCVAPSRWEGLGLHLYEAMALGLPVITNDNPPMNEVVRDRENGLLVKARRRGRAKSGIPAYLPSVRALARAMSEAGEPPLLAELRRGAAAARERFAWEHTLSGYEALIRSVS